MGIPSQQIGWSQKDKLLWNISKQLEQLTQVAGNIQIDPVVPTTTTTTTTIALFNTTIYWGEDTPTACAGIIPIVVTGDGTTFCNSDNFTSEDFRTIGTGTIVISYGGQQKIVSVTSGSDVATSNGGCASCPATTTTTTTTVVPTTTTTTTVAPGDNFIATETNDELITENGNNLIMNYPLPTSEIITEDGNFVITENGDNLTTQ